MVKEEIIKIFGAEKSRTMQASRIFAARAKEMGVTDFTKDICKTLRNWFKKEIIPLDPYWETKSGNDALCHGLKNLANGKVKFSDSNPENNSDSNPGNNSDSNPENNSDSNPENNSDNNSENNSDNNSENNSDSNSENNSDNNPENNSDSKSENNSDSESENNSDSESENKSDSESENKSDSESENKSDSESENNSDSESENKSDNESENKSDSESENNSDSESENNSDNESENNSDSESENNSDSESENEEEEDNTIHHEKEELITKLVERNLPVYLYGPAGTGKTSVCISIAKKLGLKFYFSASVTQEHKLTGFVDANGKYNDTPFYHAFTEGGLFLIDEMDNSAPEVLTLLNAAIAQRMFVIPKFGVVKAHPDFRIIAAGNTLGTGADSEYVSRVQLDSATLNRFIPVSFDYSLAIEKAIAKDDELVDFVHSLRDAISESGISYVISYRNITYYNKLKEVLPENEALKVAFAGYMDNDNLSMVAANLDSCNKYAKMLEKAVN